MVPQSSAAEPQAFAGLAGWAAVSFAALSCLDASKAAGDTGDLDCGLGRGWGLGVGEPGCHSWKQLAAEVVGMLWKAHRPRSTTLSFLHRPFRPLEA